MTAPRQWICSSCQAPFTVPNGENVCPRCWEREQEEHRMWLARQHATQAFLDATYHERYAAATPEYRKRMQSIRDARYAAALSPEDRRRLDEAYGVARHEDDAPIDGKVH